MFEKIDLSKKLDKQEYEQTVPGLRAKLASLQREILKLNIPVIIVFEGWQAAGKGEMINNLILPLDPRGFDVYPVRSPGPEASGKPFFWRFWVKTPQKGRMAVFSRSWYHRTLADRDFGREKPDVHAVSEINYFERALAVDGFVIVKLFLHISKKEQKKRFEAIEKDASTAWMITGKSWERHKKYEQYAEAVESLIEKTDFSYAPWTIIEAEDARYAEARVLATVVETLERATSMARAQELLQTSEQSRVAQSLRSSALEKTDLSKSYSKKEYEDKLEKCQAAIRSAQFRAFSKEVPTVVLFEGWDAAGKGGAIKRLTQSLDPRGYSVVPVGAPNDLEKAHHYLWRFWTRLPAAGHFTVFDRSWYGRVLVERVENLCSRADWERAYGEINELEEQLVHSGAVLVKFWLQIDREEQLNRFRAREADPSKAWKITPEDWRNREKWDQYQAAVDEMLYRTSTTYAPWTIVEANDKNYARVKVLKTVVSAMEKNLE